MKCQNLPIVHPPEKSLPHQHEIHLRILVTGRKATVHLMLLVTNITSAYRQRTAQVWKYSIEVLPNHEICT
jgi:hypothetical protein